MAYAAKYRWQSSAGAGADGRQWTVEFRKDGYSGSVTNLNLRGLPSGLPYEITCGKRGDDVDTPVSESVAKVYVVAPTTSFLSDVEDAEDTEFLCVITSTSGSTVTEFIGLIEPNLGEKEELQNKVVMVTAKGGLDWLGNIDYPNVDDGRLSLLEHVRNCLGELPYSLPLYTMDRWFSFGLTGDPFDGAFADAIVFKDGDKPRSCRYVLEQCMRRKGLNLRQSEGFWHIQQPDSCFSGTTERNEYNAAGVLQNTDTAYDPSVEYDGAAFTSRAPMVGEREAFGQIDIEYNHRKLGETLFENGDFSEIEGVDPWELLKEYSTGEQVIEGGAIYQASSDHVASTDSRPGMGSSATTVWSLVTSANDVQPADWTVSDSTKTRLNNEKLSIDAFFRPGFDPGNVDSLSVWYVEQAGGSVTLNETVPGTLVFDANWLPGRQPRAGITRPLPWTFKVGTKWWDDDNEEWSASKVVNAARVSYAAEQHRFPMSAWPETGAATLGFYAIIDDRAVFKYGGSGLNDDIDSWDTDLAGTVEIDNVNVELASAEGIEAASRTLSTVLDSGSNQKTRSYSLDIGQGPTRDHLSRLTLSGGSQATGWQYEDDFTGGSSGVEIDQFHGPRFMSMLRKPRTAKTWNFRFKTSGLRPHQVIEESGVRFWPAYFSMCPYVGVFGEFEGVRIRRDGETGLSLTAASTRSGTGLGGNRTQVYQGFETKIENTSLAFRITKTSDTLPADVYSGIPIEATTEEIGEAGIKVVLFNHYTAEEHVLTLTRPIKTGQGVMNIEQYTLSNPVPSGAPVVLHAEGILQKLLAHDQVISFSVKQGAIGQVDGAQRGNLATLDVHPMFADAQAGDELGIVNVSKKPNYLVQISADADQNAVSLSLVNTPFVDADDGAYIWNSSRQRRAELQVRPSKVKIEVEDNTTNIDVNGDDIADNVSAIASVEASVDDMESEVVLKAQIDVNDQISKLALVALTASVVGGSAITLRADQVNIDGTTTFAAGYDPTDYLEEISAGALAFLDEVETTDLGTTIIQGGVILTTLLDVDEIFAENASITGTLTMSGLGEIVAPGVYTIDPSGIDFEDDATLTIGGGSIEYNSGGPFLRLEADGDSLSFGAALGPEFLSSGDLIVNGGRVWHDNNLDPLDFVSIASGTYSPSFDRRITVDVGGFTVRLYGEVV